MDPFKYKELDKLWNEYVSTIAEKEKRRITKEYSWKAVLLLFSLSDNLIKHRFFFVVKLMIG